MAKITYQAGFGNHFVSEALPNSVPQGQNSPQKCPRGLYAEQLSGTAFTAPRHLNERSWLYKIRPSVASTTPYKRVDHPTFSNKFSEFIAEPTQLRWKEMPFPEEGSSVDFIQGMVTMVGNGDPSMKSGLAVYMYSCNQSMNNKAFYSSDGDFIIVPQVGTLTIKTEMGIIEAEPMEIVVIPRGVKFSVEVSGNSRGYASETFSGHLKIPNLGPIGANGLANPRDFLVPVAWFEDKEQEHTIVNKYCGELFEYSLPHSVFDVVGWHGNYYPYKYDLRLFNAVNTVTFDHPDPSIFTVLTCQSLEPGVAVLDFVVFPPRWIVAEHTFRPPYFHRNTMNEFMGNIIGDYDAKEAGFTPGTASLHSCMSGHGPEVHVFEKASNEELKPTVNPPNTFQVMFESTYMLKVAPWAMETEKLDNEYLQVWQGFNKHFTD